MESGFRIYNVQPLTEKMHQGKLRPVHIHQFLSDLKNQTIVSSCVTHICHLAAISKVRNKFVLTLLVGIW